MLADVLRLTTHIGRSVLPARRWTQTFTESLKQKSSARSVAWISSPPLLGKCWEGHGLTADFSDFSTLFGTLGYFMIFWMNSIFWQQHSANPNTIRYPSLSSIFSRMAAAKENFAPVPVLEAVGSATPQCAGLAVSTMRTMTKREHVRPLEPTGLILV